MKTFSKKNYINELIKSAKKKRGKLLSTEYIDAKQKMKWECAFKHVWYASGHHIKNGSWCPTCAISLRAKSRILKRSVFDLKKMAEKNNGKCLSNEYKGASHKYIWQCNLGHKFQMSFHKIQQGSWCQKCGVERRSSLRKLDISECNNYAKLHGGLCLSTSYKNMKVPMKWKCKRDHIWNASFDSLKGKGAWCPRCSINKSEKICRIYFEKYFGVKFPKARPKWLISLSNTKLELDGYNEQLKIAFEHHGEYHYSLAGFYSKTTAALKHRISVDKLKKKLCKKNNVILIEIPALGKRTKIEDLYKIIESELKKHKKSKLILKIKPDTDKIRFEVTDEIQALQSIAKQHGGKCHSRLYLNAKTYIDFECSEGHIFKTTAERVFNGRWCRLCGRVKAGKKMRGRIEDLQLIAKSRDGELISVEYKNAVTPVEWKCIKGHTWYAKPSAVKMGTWCPFCAGKRHNVGDLQKTAKIKGGRCLAVSYKGSDYKYSWECKEGHIWKATFSNVRKSSWCPHCHKLRKKNHK